jgi:hypothetical protein
MKTDEQRVAIAKLLGWKSIRQDRNQPERTMNTEQQRKEFEEWASSNTTIGLDLELDSDEVGNYYWDISTYAAWEAWQAAQKELTAVTEQRDRLADLVKQFISILDITEESDGGRLFHPTNITSCRAGDLQKIGELVEALRRSSNDR